MIRSQISRLTIIVHLLQFSEFKLNCILLPFESEMPLTDLIFFECPVLSLRQYVELSGACMR